MNPNRLLRNLNDRTRLLLILAILLCAGFAATSLVSYSVSRASIRDAIVATELPLTSDNVYSEIQKDLVRPILISSMMARDTFLREWVLGGERDVPKMTRYLKEIMSHYGTFTSFFVSDKSRTYYHADGVLKQIKENEPRDVWYFRVRDLKEPYEINVDPDLANRDKLTIFINYRVYDFDHRFIGATGVGLTVDAVLGMIHDYQERYGRSIFFTDAQGRIVLAGQQKNNYANVRSLGEIEGLAERAGEILRAGSGSFSFDANGQRHYLNVRYIPELKWHLFVAKTEDQALSEIQRTLYINLALCSAITLLVLGIVYLAVNRYQRRLEELATTDSLTGLTNRHGLRLLLDQAMREADRLNTPLCAIMLDVDHFKRFNDSYGHLAGDRILQGVAQRLRNSRRASDIVCRWGGEEFLVILKNTDLPAAAKVAEDLRARVANASFHVDGIAVHTTLSAGVARYRPQDVQDGFILRADTLLYEAKEAGRNRVCSEKPEGAD